MRLLAIGRLETVSFLSAVFQNQVFVEGSDPPSASLTNQSARKVLAGRFLEGP